MLSPPSLSQRISRRSTLLLGRGRLLVLPDALLLARHLDQGGASLRQWLRALDWLAEQHAVVDDLLLQLLELGADDAVALRAGQAQLEPIEVGQVATLSLGGGTLLPSGGRELFLQVVGFQSLADHLGLGGVRELHPVFGQMQVVHGVLLAGNTGGGAIDEYPILSPSYKSCNFYMKGGD